MFRQEDGTTFLLGQELASGGEGRIFAIQGEPSQVAKLYHKTTPEHAEKLGIMVKSRPDDPTLKEDPPHVSIAWPLQRIYDSDNCFRGFTMPYIKFQQSQLLLKLYNPRDRLLVDPGFNWKLLLNTAFNLAFVVHKIHSENYVIGDINESNIFVTPEGLVTLIDCDSIQVPNPSKKKKFFLCTVGKPEYTPPELQEKDFSQVTREQYHDDFGLAVLIFIMLMEGRHPFSGVWRGEGPPPTLAQHIKAGRFPYAKKANQSLTLPKSALPFDVLPEEVQELMQQCFEKNLLRQQKGRPTAENWVTALDKAARELHTCPKNPEHFFSGHLNYCPWCDRIRLGLPDPFPALYGTSPAPVQPFPSARPTTKKNSTSPNPTSVDDDAETPVATKQRLAPPMPRRRERQRSEPNARTPRQRLGNAKQSQHSNFMINVLVTVPISVTLILYAFEFTWLNNQPWFHSTTSLASFALYIIPLIVGFVVFAFIWTHKSKK